MSIVGGTSSKPPAVGPQTPLGWSAPRLASLQASGAPRHTRPQTMSPATLRVTGAVRWRPGPDVSLSAPWNSSTGRDALNTPVVLRPHANHQAPGGTGCRLSCPYSDIAVHSPVGALDTRVFAHQPGRPLRTLTRIAPAPRARRARVAPHRPPLAPSAGTLLPPLRAPLPRRTRRPPPHP
jgi:hypothetical protein